MSGKMECRESGRITRTIGEKVQQMNDHFLEEGKTKRKTDSKKELADKTLIASLKQWSFINYSRSGYVKAAYPLLLYLEKKPRSSSRKHLRLGMIIPHTQVNPERCFLHLRALVDSGNIGDSNVRLKGGHFYRM